MIYEDCITIGDSAFAGWTSDQKVYVIASLYDITGYWYEMVSSSSFKGYWTGTEAEFVFEYNESSK